MQEVKLTRNEIAEILDVKVSALKKIELRGSLENRLLEKNLKLLEKIKEGRNSFYILEPTFEMTFEKFSKKHRVRKKEFKFYIIAVAKDIENDFQINTKFDYAQILNVDRRNISKWQNILLKEKFIIKDGYAYYRLSPGVKEEIGEDTYKKYWLDKSRVRKYIKELEDELLAGRISGNEALKEALHIGAKLGVDYGICLKTFRYSKGKNYDVLIKMVRK